MRSISFTIHEVDKIQIKKEYGRHKKIILRSKDGDELEIRLFSDSENIEVEVDA